MRRLGSSLRRLVQFLRGLEEHEHRAFQEVSHRGQEHRRPENAGGVQVVPEACMRPAPRRRRKAPTLPARECVHVRTKGRHRAGALPSKRPTTPVPPHRVVRKTQCLQREGPPPRYVLPENSARDGGADPGGAPPARPRRRRFAPETARHIQDLLRAVCFHGSFLPSLRAT